MFGLCWRESGAPLGIRAFGCFSTQCYRAHDDVHQLQTDTSVWCSCLQICLWLPAKQPLWFRDLGCSVLPEFSATYHHIIGADLSDWMLYSISYAVHENNGGSVCVCEYGVTSETYLYTLRCSQSCRCMYALSVCVLSFPLPVQPAHNLSKTKQQMSRKKPTSNNMDIAVMNQQNVLRHPLFSVCKRNKKKIDTSSSHAVLFLWLAKWFSVFRNLLFST